MVNYGSAIFEPSCFAEDGPFAGFPIGTGPYVVTGGRPWVSLLRHRAQR